MHLKVQNLQIGRLLSLVMVACLLCPTTLAAEWLGGNNTVEQPLLQQMAQQPKSSRSRIVINIPSRTLSLFVDGQLLKMFPVGVGRPQFKTPVGRFKVITKTEYPAWENPYLAAGKVRIQAGTNNPLGTRWIGFLADDKGEYGIHGTDSPASVGKLSSHGCVRMYVKDAEFVFNYVQLGTPVDVTYDTIVAVPEGSEKVVLKMFPDVYNLGKKAQEEAPKMIQELYGGKNIRVIFMNLTQEDVTYTLPTQTQTKPILITTPKKKAS